MTHVREPSHSRFRDCQRLARDGEGDGIAINRFRIACSAATRDFLFSDLYEARQRRPLHKMARYCELGVLALVSPPWNASLGLLSHASTHQKTVPRCALQAVAGADDWLSPSPPSCLYIVSTISLAWGLLDDSGPLHCISSFLPFDPHLVLVSPRPIFPHAHP